MQHPARPPLLGSTRLAKRTAMRNETSRAGGEKKAVRRRCRGGGLGLLLQREDCTRAYFLLAALAAIKEWKIKSAWPTAAHRSLAQCVPGMRSDFNVERGGKEGT